tara:strand:+ start:2860 stop:7473 length:4614 start_codon:yes stop_codon:yes gene_type:complete
MKRIKGLNKDTSPIDQPAGTYRYAKNCIIDVTKMCIKTEDGDKEILDEGGLLVGFVVLDNDSIVLFSVKDTESIIGVWDGLAYSEIFSDAACVEKLNFDVHFSIEAEYKINATSNTSVYWTDDKNPPRYINITNPPIAAAGLNIAVTFDIFPKIDKYPKIFLTKVTNGGTLDVGAYWITCQYVSADGATTNVLDISNTIYINETAETTATSKWGIGEDYQVNTYDGADPGASSGKKITMSVRNIDTSYPYLRPIAVYKNAGAIEAVSLPDISLSPGTDSVSIQYTGYESSATFSLDELQIPRSSYDKAKTIAQVDDVLYLGNLIRTKVDIGYQKYANSIKIESTQLDPNGNGTSVPSNLYGTAAIAAEPTHSSNMADLNLYNSASAGLLGYTASTDNGWGFGRSAYDNYYFKGYERDEVYAFYITWILKDGTESKAYHIPGRETNLQNTIGGLAENEPITNNANLNNSNLYLGNNAMYTSVYNAASSPYIYQITTENSLAFDGRNMGYWENKDEYYPQANNDTNDDFQVWGVVNGVSQQIGNDNLHGQRVRHHHFPAESQGEQGVMDLDYVKQGGGFIYDNNGKTGQTSVSFNPLGFKAYDIPYPSEIKDLVLGYKIYYAKRTSENATVLDYGLVHNTGANPEDGETRRYLTPIGLELDNAASEAEKERHTRNLTFTGLHSLITGDSIEGASMFKANKYVDLGSFGGGDSHLSYFKGVETYSTTHLGVETYSKRALKLHIDWTRNRPHNYGTDSYSGLGSTTAQGLFGAGFNAPLNPIAGISYIPAGTTNTASFEDNTFVNSNNSQTIGILLHQQYRIQSYGRLWDGAGDPLGLSFNPGLRNDNGTGAYNEDNGFIDKAEPGWHQSPADGNEVTAGVFGSLYSLKDNVYKGFEDQFDLVYTGHLYTTNALDDTLGANSGAVINPAAGNNAPASAEIIMGGDVFLAMTSVHKKGTFQGYDYNADNDQWRSPFGNFKFNSSVAGSEAFIYATHIFPTSSRSHITMRESQPDNLNSYFFPSKPLNHTEFLTNPENFSRDYDFNDDFNSQNTVKLLSVFDYKNPLSTLQDFPTRIIRSIKYNQSGLTDNFRVFLPSQYRDLPRHRGELWRLESMKSVLVPHTEKALMLTRGKEELAVGSVSAALGSGDLFERDPTEVITTERGEGGTQSQFAGVVSKAGYFFVSSASRKVYLFGEQLEEISEYGMSEFFRDNLKQPLWDYGLPLNADFPTLGLGAVAGYDPDLDKFTLTYKVITPNGAFPGVTTGVVPGWDADNRYFARGNNIYELTDSTYFTHSYWTISYYPSLKAWGSFHNYNPTFYAYTSLEIFKLFTSTDNDTESTIVTTSSNTAVPGSFLDTSSASPYQTSSSFVTKNMEFEFIDNTSPIDTKLFSSINWLVDVESPVQGADNKIKLHSPGFTHLFVYNSQQMSEEKTITPFSGNLLGNCRKLERGWYFNDFRDDAVLSLTNGVQLPSQAINMFESSGMNINQNTAYVNANAKSFDTRKKFTDKYLGVRLLDKSTESQRKVISLYLSDTSKRKVYR